MLHSEGAISLSDIRSMSTLERATLLYAFREHARRRDEEIERRSQMSDRRTQLPDAVGRRMGS